MIILGRLPLVLLWTWLNVLIFDLANQRLPNSIIEDSINKSWRPIPSGRLSAAQARRLLLGNIPLVFLVTFYMGGMEETVAMFVLTWMYNDLGGADESYIVRNLINALGFMSYSSGATRVACGYGHCFLNDEAYQWLAIIGGIVFSTLQAQDMGKTSLNTSNASADRILADQEGDRARGRGTLPLIHGDWIARWTIAVPVMFWTVACLLFWELGLYAWILPSCLGGLVAFRTLVYRTVDGDKLTWYCWNFWITSLYLLPLVKYYGLRL